MPNYFNDISYIIESDIRQQVMLQQKNKIKKKTTKQVRFRSFSSDKTCIATHSDNFSQMALRLGWNYCKLCNTLVVNVDEEGKCNPPCR